MPVYEYKCPKCGTERVIRHKHDDTKVYACLLCKKPLKRQISKPTVIFKGGGWTPKHYK